jgi:acetyl-CoA carboxylase biotin carboxyl carrier protein
VSERALTALIAGGLDIGDNVVLRAPGVGVWRPAIGMRGLIRPGELLGHLEVLGAAHRVIAPEGARGLVSGVAPGAERSSGVPVGYGTLLFRIDPASELGTSGAFPAVDDPIVPSESGLAFTAPTSGRFYSRPGPGKPPFVQAGDVVRDGQTVCLLEVMKTFNRVVYDAASAGLPAEARVVEIAVADEADVDAGAVLLRLEAL